MDGKKKILMVCESFGGGVFAYVSQLCNDLVEYFDISLAYSIRSQTPKNYKELLDEHIHLFEIKDFGNLRKIHSVKKQLRKIEEELQPDIIHLHSSIAGAVGRLVFKGKKNVVLYTPHGYAHILLGSGLKSKLYFLAEKWLGKKNCITLTCCESEDVEAKKFSKRTYFIETGIDIDSFDSVLKNVIGERNEKFTVYTLGRACIQKQPHVFNEIAKLVPNARFVWIGNGELEAELSAPNVEITGWKPRMEALEIAKGADVFILCSLGEAIAMSLLENMFLEKLCLVSNTMGNKSVIQNGINGFVCNTPEEYANVIKKAMNNYPHEIAHKAYLDVVNIYNTETMKTKYIKFYSGLENKKD